MVDASALVVVLTEQTSSATALAERFDRAELHAPNVFDAEVGDVLRRKVLRGEIKATTALTGLISMDGVVAARYPHSVLARAAWELRDHVRYYDALYVALASRLRLPLITADTKLGRAHDLPCKVELV